MRTFLGVVLVALACVACNKGPSLVGTWSVSGMPQMEAATHTFNSDGTNNMKATVDSPMGKVTLDIGGTYTLEEKKLTISPTTLDVSAENSMVADQIEKAAGDNFKKPQAGTIEWKGDDEFVLTPTDGTPVTYKRT